LQVGGKIKIIKFNTAIIVFLGGIFFDLLTTLIGLRIGLKEGNPFGIKWIIIINFLVVILLLFTHPKLELYFNSKEKGYRLVVAGLILVGIFRFSIGILNTITKINSI